MNKKLKTPKIINEFISIPYKIALHTIYNSVMTFHHLESYSKILNPLDWIKFKLWEIRMKRLIKILKKLEEVKDE